MTSLAILDSTRTLPLAWLLFVGFGAAVPAHGADVSTTSASIAWMTPPPCSEEHAQILPAQPPIGLALFRFSCPGQHPRLASGKRRMLVRQWTVGALMARGEPLTAALAKPGAEAVIDKMSDLPVDPAQFGAVQAKRPLLAGEALLARDFEPRRLWIGAEPVMIVLRHGAVATSLMGQSLGVGRQGERASAKTDQGKVFTGIATLCADAPCLAVPLGGSGAR
jgi:flagella basal body P-ring formation protein FlgA